MYEHVTYTLSGEAGIIMHVPKVSPTAMGPMKPRLVAIWTCNALVPMIHTTRKHAAEWLRECRKQIRRHRTLDA